MKEKLQQDIDFQNQNQAIHYKKKKLDILLRR